MSNVYESLTGVAPPDVSREEYANRRATTYATMSRLGVDRAVITAPEDIYYLTGLDHQGHFSLTALILASDDKPAVVARAMEEPLTSAQVPDCAFVGYGEGQDAADAITGALRAGTTTPGRVGYQPESMSLPVAVQQRVRQRLPKVSWLDIGETLVEQRAVRSEAELACVRRAAQLSDIGMSAAIAAATDGKRECDIAAVIYAATLGAGGDQPGFAPVVRTVDRIDHDHVYWSREAIRPGDTVVVEMSAAHARYHAPLARTIVPASHGDGSTVAGAALDGLEAIRAGLVSGRTAEEVYWDWQRTVTVRTGVQAKRHHCGYLVGIGFPPSWLGGNTVIGLRPGNTMPLRCGMAFHIQSWVLHSPLGSFAVNDTALVTDDGGELLTRTPHLPIAGTTPTSSASAETEPH